MKALLAELAKRPELLALVTRLLRAILSSDDPVAAAQRAAKAVAAKAAARKTADAALRAKAALRRKLVR